MKRILYILMFILFSYCSQHKEKISEDQLEYTFLKEENSVNPKIVGIWKSIGNGYYIEAKKDSMLLYSYTKNFTYKEKNDYLEGLLNSQSRFDQRADTIGIYLTDFGEQTKTLQSKKDFIKVKELPKDYITYDQMQKLPSKELFKLYIETLEENYAFKNERKLDWKEILETYGDSISETTSREQLFKIMGAIATKTRDQHTKVIAEDGRTLQYSITPSAEKVKEVFNTQSEIENLNDYFNLFFETNYKNVSDSLLLGKGRKVANGKLEWGSLNDNIGYINIHSFAGFASKKYTRKQQIDSINYYMQKIIKSFADKEAIIVDVSFNFGGYDASGLTIAGYFTDDPILAYFQQVYSNGAYYNEDSVIVEPADSINYTKPVYLLMTDITRSAGESFAMMMDALPNVKLVGTNTLGTLSGMLGKSIGDFYTTSSNQRLISVDNKFYEVTGVEPAINLNVFPREHIFNGHKNAVREIIKIINSNKTATNNAADQVLKQKS